MPDMGVIQRGKRFGLSRKARAAFRVGGERVRQNLDRDIAFELPIACARYTSPMPPAPISATIS
jgi:hypothetical protein